jgi:hypothetical protein
MTESFESVDIPNRILQDTKTELFKAHRPGLPFENRDEWNPYLRAAARAGIQVLL